MTEPASQNPRPHSLRWLKATALILAGCLLLVGFFAAALPALVSSDFARRELAARIQAATGRATTLERIHFTWGDGLAVDGLRIGPGDIDDPGFLCALASLRLDFGFDSVWGRKIWASLDLSGLRVRHSPSAPPAAPPTQELPPAQALKQGLEALRQALQPIPFSGDLRLNATIRDTTALIASGGKPLRVQVPQITLEAPGLRRNPVRLALAANATVGDAPLPPLDFQAEVSELVDGQRLLRPGAAKLAARLRTTGLDLDVSGSLSTGLKSVLAVDLEALGTAFAPLLPPGSPAAKGRVALTTLASLKGQDALSASLVLTADALALSGGPLGPRSLGPLSLSLMQEAGVDLASGTLEMPGALSIQEASKASWLVRGAGISEARPEFTLRVDTLRLDLGDMLRPMRALLPADVKLAAARLDSGPILAALRLSDAPGTAPALKAEARELVLSARGVQAGPATSRISVGGVELRLDKLNASLPENAPGSASIDITANIDGVRLSGPKTVAMRHAELSRLSVSGGDVRLASAALFGLAGRFTVDMASAATGFEVAGLLSAPGITKAQHLTLELPPEQRLALTVDDSRADIPGLRLLRPGRPAVVLPVHFQASAHGVALARDSAGKLAPSLGEARLEMSIGQAAQAKVSASLSQSRQFASTGALSLDADKLAPLLAAVLPQRTKASGALGLDWNVQGTLPGPFPSANNAPLSSRLKSLDFLHKAEATLSLKALSLDLPLAAKPGQKPETLRLRGLSTPRPLRLATSQGLAESSASGTLAFGPMDELPGVGRLRKPASGLFTLNAAQQGLRSAQVAQMLTLEGFKLSENLSLTLDKLDALLDGPAAGGDRLATALERVDATGSFSLTSSLDALPQVSDTGVSGRGGVEVAADVRLAGGRSLTLGARLRSPGLDLRMGPELALTGLTSDLSLRRRYALRPGLACPGAGAQDAVAPLSEQVFDLFPGPSSPLSPASDFGLRTLYDAQARRSGALAFAALDLRSGPLPLSLRDFALALDTSGPLPAVQSFRLGLFGGNVLGRAAITGGSGAYTLDASCAFTGIDTARMLPGRAEKDLGDQAELSGRVSLRLPLTPDPEALLTRMNLSADITKVGPRTLERALYALDPDEANETIVQQRRLMGIGYPRNLNLRIAYGNLSLSGQVEVKGFRLDIPPIDRLSVANLPIKSQLGPALRPVPALLDMLDLVSATSICRDPSQSGQQNQTGRFGSLNLSRTAPAQGATP